MSETAEATIERFLQQWPRMRGLHPEEIHTIHADPDGGPAAITVSGLREILTALASERSRADRLEQDLERVKTGLREVEHISAACFAQDPDEGYEAIRDLSRRLLASVEENRQ